MAQLSPIFNIPYFTDNNGDPLAGGRIFAYEAGSGSVLKATYVDEAESAENPNPIVLDSAGRLPGSTAIWLTANELYNLVLTAPDGTTVLKSFDDVSGVVVSTGGGGGGGTSSVWVETPGATYLSNNSFLVPGNFTTQYALGNRVRITQPGVFTYGVVTSVSFASGNTTVTVLLDGVAFNPALTKAEYSILFAAPNETVDAGGVSYFDALAYSTANTVGNKMKLVEASVTSVTNRVGAMRQVWAATGPAGTYVVTVSPAVTSYSADQILTVRFANAGSGAATININGVGAVPLVQYDSAGVAGTPIIAANQVSDIAYNGTVFVLLDALTPAATAVPRGIQVFTSNNTFTVPAGVSFIKVTCIGGGGGGGSSTQIGSGEDPSWGPGGGGGGACTSVRYITTTPGTTYSVSIGGIGVGGNFGIFGAANGTAGGATTFGITLVTAPGGGGGIAGFSPAGGAGGAGGTGDLVMAGMPGAVTAAGAAASGGASYGTGGTGAAGVFGQNGSNGAPGVCYVEW